MLNYKNVTLNNEVLNYLTKDQVRLTELTNSLNYALKKNEALVLQYILLQNKASRSFEDKAFEDIDNTLATLDDFLRQYQMPQELTELYKKIKKRVTAYKIVERSIIQAFQANDRLELEDAILGFNSVTEKFAQDMQQLSHLSNQLLYQQILTLQKNNDKNALTLLLSFITAFLLIIYAIYKFNKLHTKLQEAQNKLLRYNENLQEQIKEKTQELYTKIYTHPITLLPNRNKLIEDIPAYNFKRMALLNIDHFQSFNDVYGEKIGNIALKLTGDFLQKEVAQLPVLLYHIGGDEFVIVCVDETNENNQIFIDAINTILNNYKHHTFSYKDKIFQFIMSCGITFTGKYKMLAYADMALKDAKKKNVQISIFHEDRSLEEKHKNNLECHKKLLSALGRNAILSYFQPIVPIQDETKALKYESLVRLEDEDGKIIPPFHFLNVAKAHRIYHKITRAVIKNTLDVIRRYQVPCSINFSLSDIQNPKTMQAFFSTLDEFEYNELLSIELLETEDFQDYNSVYDFCLKVRSYGVKVSLDDFGSGYSNFSHILNLPIDFIKIDASLISNIDKNNNSRLMVETIVTLAKKLNVQTIAEFVSSEEILNVIKELGVDYAQGFHLGKPLRIEEHLKS